MSPSRRIAVFFSVATVLGLFSAARRHFDNLANHRWESPWPILLDEITAVWLVTVLVLLVVSAAERYPIVRHWWAYALAAPVYAALHTLGMYVSRSLLYPLLGLGKYQYGDLAYRFLMEAPIQLLGYGFTLLAVTIYARLKRARDAERLEGLLAEARLERLRLSIAPHFLFNTLNVISAAVYESPEKADELIGRLSRLLRALLSAEQDQTCSLEQELALLDEYLALQKARFENDLSLDIHCPRELRSGRVPFMILQPIVENALEHGADERGRVQLRVRASRQADTLLLDVEDRGPGPGSSKAGIGTRNTQERLSTLYGDGFGLELGPRSGGGTLARLRMPWQCAS